MSKFLCFILPVLLASIQLSAQCPVTITPSGATTFCKGDSVTLTASNGIGYTWQWKKNGTSISGATSQTYKAKTGGSYTVLVTATGGCTSLSAAIPVTVTLESVYITANGYTGIGCLNGTVNLATNTAGLTYQWKLNGNNINGAVSINYTGTQAGTYSCQISNGSCTAITNTLPVQNQVATLVHYGPTIFCIDQTILTTTLNMASSPTYQWKNNGVVIPGATMASYTASTSGNYTCVVTDANFCNASTTSGGINIQAGVPPQISVTATNGAWPVNLCNGQTIDLQINDVSTGQVWPGGVADWYKDGVSINPFGGNYLLGVSESGVYNAYITTSCGISFAQLGIPIVSLDPANPPVVNNNGVTSDCHSIFLYVDPAGVSFAPYQWKRNGINIPGETNPTIYATLTGNYTCQVSNTCTTMVTAPVSANITGPIAQITPQGSTTICSGNNVVLDATTGGASGYQWYLNSVAIGGATASTYAATLAGSYYVRVSSPGCGFVNSTPVTVTVNATPSPTITPSGPTSFCTGGSVTLTTNNTGGASYKWKKNGANIPGAVTASYTTTSSGNYKVVKTNSFGCSGTSAATAVTVYSNPSVAITAQGPTTFCAGDSVQLKAPLNNNYSYQWKRNNVNVSGATGNKYQAKIQGSFKVKVTNGNGCTVLSNGISVSVPCREGESIAYENKSFLARIYPNPSTGDVTLEGIYCDNGIVTYQVFDYTGREVKCHSVSYDKNKWMISGLPPGVFHILIRQNENSNIVKLVRL